MAKSKREKEKEIDWIERQLEQEFNAGRMPWCMDDPDDRARMAEWIYNNFRL